MVVTSSSMERTAQTAAKLEAVKSLDRLVEEGAKTPEEAAAEKERLLKQQLACKKWRVNMRVLLGMLLIIVLGMAVLRALAEPSGLAWLFAVVPPSEAVGDVALVLGPLLAVSVAVERLLETAFDAFEQSSRAVADLLAAPKEALDWIGREYQAAYEAAAAAAHAVAEAASDETLAALAAAEARLAQAEARVRAWTSAPEYIAWKRAICIWAGLVAGLVVAIFGDLGMIRTIGAPAPRLLDMVITGFVIGAGPGPMHALIGIIQSGKDAANNLADLARSKAAELRASADALKRK